MRKASIAKPIFFTGVPRSGTTIAFEAFARHPNLAWPTNYTAQFPRLPQLNLLRRLLDNSRLELVGRKNQYGRARLGNRFLPMPNEAYEFWNRHGDPRFARDYLDAASGLRARSRLSGAVQNLVSWQGKQRFAAKLTGPPRIGFLSAVFPDAIFVHIVRDGRAVVHSLLKVGFWREKGGFEAPFWSGGPSNAWSGNPSGDPGVLAALQWRDILAAARQEAAALGPGQYVELRYEDLVIEPAARLHEVARQCGLPDCDAIDRYLRNSEKLSNMNSKYLRDFSPGYVDELARAMQPQLSLYGYTAA
ncbi:MAG: sulfotransferase family protein [Steroidobacteraceae bacterium]